MNTRIFDAERKILEHFNRSIISPTSLTINISKTSCPWCREAARAFALRNPGVSTTMYFPGGGVFYNSMLNNIGLGTVAGSRNVSYGVSNE